MKDIGADLAPLGSVGGRRLLTNFTTGTGTINININTNNIAN